MFNYKSENPHYKRVSKMTILAGVNIGIGSAMFQGFNSVVFQGIFWSFMIALGLLCLLLGIYDSHSSRFLSFEEGDVIAHKNAEQWGLLENFEMEIVKVGKESYEVVNKKGKSKTINFFHQTLYKETTKNKGVNNV